MNRCHYQGKVQFSRDRARRAAVLSGLRHYRCEHCRLWHLTSKRTERTVAA